MASYLMTKMACNHLHYLWREFKGLTQSQDPQAVILKVWFLGQQHQHHLGTCWNADSQGLLLPWRIRNFKSEQAFCSNMRTAMLRQQCPSLVALYNHLPSFENVLS